MDMITTTFDMPPVHPGGGPALVSLPALYKLVQDQGLTQLLQKLSSAQLFRTTGNFSILIVLQSVDHFPFLSHPPIWIHHFHVWWRQHSFCSHFSFVAIDIVGLLSMTVVRCDDL